MITLLFLILVIFLIIFGTTKLKLHPFYVLILATLLMGYITGLESSVIIKSLAEGFGKTLSSIGIIIALGTIIGTYLEKSGGAMVLANTVIKFLGEKKSVLAANITGFIVSIPVFCDSGFIILSALNKALSKKLGISVVVFAISLSAGLYATHVFVPPTPGPLAAAAILEADLGMLIILGLVVAVFSSAAGYFWSKFIGKKIIITSSSVSENKDASSYSPNRTFSFAPILMPVVLIALKSISDYPTHPFGEGIIHSTISFVGEPIIAIIIGTFFALTLKKDKKASHFNWMETGIREAGIIILITGAGGAFGNVLREGGIGDVIGENLSQLNLGIFLPFILAAVIKSAQGSSTVAIVTTAAIISPLLDILGLTTEMGRVLAVLSIGAGAMTVSHLNDSYFWVVSQFSEMNTSQALRSQTISTLLQGIAGIMVISILSAVLT